jgi:hypothetical protein
MGPNAVTALTALVNTAHYLERSMDDAQVWYGIDG